MASMHTLYPARRLFRRTIVSACVVVAVVLVGCGTAESDKPVPVWPPSNLTAYGLFVGDGSTQQPTEGVIPYDLNTPLFSDYTSKHRFIKLPAGASAKYHESEPFDFPVGTVIAKTFAMRLDHTDPNSKERLLETRILEHRPEGWVGLPYVWNADQTEAVLRRVGAMVDVRWVHNDGVERTNNYIIPNMNQCKGCHKVGRPMLPIGPRARHLNREFAYDHGSENQLAYWSRVGALTGAPSADEAPRLAVWDDPATGTVAERARAWLEINCAHCHNEDGPASNAGLDLMAHQRAPVKYGVFKSPAAAGPGSGGLSYDIVPGKPDESILLYRIASTEPQVMMPELGKRLVHTESLELIRQWIREMEHVETDSADTRARASVPEPATTKDVSQEQPERNESSELNPTRPEKDRSAS